MAKDQYNPNIEHDYPPHLDDSIDVEYGMPTSRVSIEKAEPIAVIANDTSENDVQKSTVNVSTVQHGTESSVGELSWDGEDDSRNPKNWSTSRKWTITILVSLFTFCTLMTSTLVAPALSNIEKDLHIKSDVEAQLVISSFVLSYAFGPFLWAPLSEQHGRLVVLQIAGVWYIIWNSVCGFAPNRATMIVGRVLSGIGGAGALAVEPGVLSDTWAAHQRGRSQAIMALIPLLAPSLGPIIGGQFTHYATWRWAFWSTSLYNIAVQILAIFSIRETHAPTILRRIHQKQNTPVPASPANVNERDNDENTTHKALLHTVYVLIAPLRRPLQLLLTQAPIQLVSVWACYSFGVLFIVMSGYGTTFEQVYGQTASTASLNYLSIGIGYLLGSQITGRVADLIYRRRQQQHQQQQQRGDEQPGPELRLVLLLPATALTVTGLLLYGWTARPSVHWSLPNLGMVLYSLGQQAGTQTTNAYVIDSYSGSGGRKFWSASAMAGVWALKSLGGFALPLLAPAVQHRLGLGRAMSVWAAGSAVVGFGLAGVLACWGWRMRESGSKKLASID